MLFVVKLNAQQDLTIYNLNTIPQSSYSNPAFIPDCKWYIGFPALSSLYFGLSNNAFNTKNVFQVDKGNNDSVIINVNNFLKNLHKNNYLSFDFQEELLAFGFKMKNDYLTFSLSTKGFMLFNYPKDFLPFFIKGNADPEFLGKTANFSGTGLNAMYYHELAFGYNHKVNEKLTVGGRVKALFGVADIQTKKSDLTIYTSPESDMYNISVASQFNVNENIPGSENGTNTTATDFMGTKNMGFGLDLGGTYKYNDKFTFSLSLLDLGYIRWKSIPHNFSYTSNNANFSFQGFDLGKIINTASQNADSTYFKNFQDSLSKIFDTKKTSNAYTTYLPMKIQLGGTYNLTDKDVIGALLRGEFLAKRLFPAFSLSYTRKFGKIFQISANYNIRNRSYTNVGLGFALTLGTVQLYVLTDNIFSAINFDQISFNSGQSFIYPQNQQNINFRFGINFVFGNIVKKNKSTLSFESK